MCVCLIKFSLPSKLKQLEFGMWVMLVESNFSLIFVKVKCVWAEDWMLHLYIDISVMLHAMQCIMHRVVLFAKQIPISIMNEWMNQHQSTYDVHDSCPYWNSQEFFEAMDAHEAKQCLHMHIYKIWCIECTQVGKTQKNGVFHFSLQLWWCTLLFFFLFFYTNAKKILISVCGMHTMFTMLTSYSISNRINTIQTNVMLHFLHTHIFGLDEIRKFDSDW